MGSVLSVNIRLGLKISLIHDAIQSAADGMHKNDVSFFSKLYGSAWFIVCLLENAEKRQEQQW